MSQFVQSCAAWIRRTIPWSNSPQAWKERLGIIFLIAVGVIGGLLLAGQSLAYQVLFWGVVLVLAAVLLRRGWLKLLGPVLFYDLIRTARRGRYFLIRILYCLFLLAILSWMWLMWYVDRPSMSRPMGPNELTKFAASFFYTFMVVQFLVVTVLTPAYTAGAIAEEKDRKTLEFLLATDLRNREIVCSKLVARLCNLGMILLAGLPILGFLQLLGGVDPGLVLAGFTATVFTVMSLACISILFSVVVPKPRDAIVLAYLAVVAYATLCILGLVLMLAWPSAAGYQLTSLFGGITVSNVVDWVNSGNIVSQVWTIFHAPSLDVVLPGILFRYCLFHGVVALICLIWAVLRMRAIVLKETYGKAKKAPLTVRLFGRPPIGNWPMVWKEVFAEPRLRFHWLGKVLVFLLFLASFLPAAIILTNFIGGELGLWTYGYSWRHNDPFERLAGEMNVWVRAVGTPVMCLTLIGVAVRAASSIGSERDRQTFDSLLTSPLDSNAMLVGKWAGAMLSMRWGWVWLLGIWGLGVITGGLNPLALPLLVLAWVIHAAFVAVLGLWYSAVSKTTLRATIWTLLSIMGFWGGHWLLMGMCCYIPLATVFRSSSGRGIEDVIEWCAKFQLGGLTPPVTFGFFAFRFSDFESYYGGRRSEILDIFACGLIGIWLWAAAALFLWFLTSLKFREITNRTAFMKPDALGRTPQPRHPVVARPQARPVARDGHVESVVVAEEVRPERITPAEDGPPRPRGAVLIEEEWPEEDNQRSGPRP